MCAARVRARARPRPTLSTTSVMRGISGSSASNEHRSSPATSSAALGCLPSSLSSIWIH